MKAKNLFNTTPIKMIKIVKDMSAVEMATCFGVTTAYMHYVENGERNFRIQILKYGLDNLGITMDEYNELMEFKKFLENKELEDKEKFKYALMKTIGVLTPEVKEQIEEVLNNTLSTKIK